MKKPFHIQSLWSNHIRSAKTHSVNGRCHIYDDIFIMTNKQSSAAVSSAAAAEVFLQAVGGAPASADETHTIGCTVSGQDEGSWCTKPEPSHTVSHTPPCRHTNKHRGRYWNNRQILKICMNRFKLNLIIHICISILNDAIQGTYHS